MNSFCKENREVIHSSCVFLILVCLLCHVNNNLARHMPSFVHFSKAYTAEMVYGILNILRINTTISDYTITLQQGGALKIIYECTGIYVFIIFSAFILAYPATIRHKLGGLLIFLPLFYLVNIARIVLMGIIGTHWPRYLTLFHEYLFEATIMVLVVALAYLWILWINGRLHLKSTKPSTYLWTIIAFFSYSFLCYIFLTLFFTHYLVVLQKATNSVLYVFKNAWGTRWPIRLVIENKNFKLLHTGGQVTMSDAPCLVYNFVPFISLMFLTPLRPKIKALGILIGSVFLYLYHVFTLILIIQFTAKKWVHLYSFFRVYLLLLVPIILWVPFFYYSKKQGVREKALDTLLTPQKETQESDKWSGKPLLWSIVHMSIGAILPLIIVLFFSKPQLIGYYLGFGIWLIGLIMIVPPSPVFLSTIGKKRILIITLIYGLFWQAPLIANSLAYVPARKRFLFINAQGHPSSIAEQGFHINNYVNKNPIIFDMQDRKIRIEIEGKVKNKERPLVAVNLEVFYRISKATDLARVYEDFGATASKIDYALMRRLKKSAERVIQKNIKKIYAGVLDSAHIHHLLLNTFTDNVLSYGIEIDTLEIKNIDNPQITL
ncbi:MAG: SPFH domain-containing protein [bacterium]